MGDPGKINVWRVRKDEIHEVTFSAGDLANFSSEMRKINFKIRYPGGLEEYVEKSGSSYMSRRFVAMITDSPTANDWHPFGDLPSEPASD